MRLRTSCSCPPLIHRSGFTPVADPSRPTLCVTRAQLPPRSVVPESDSVAATWVQPAWIAQSALSTPRVTYCSALTSRVAVTASPAVIAGRRCAVNACLSGARRLIRSFRRPPTTARSASTRRGADVGHELVSVTDSRDELPRHYWQRQGHFCLVHVLPSHSSRLGTSGALLCHMVSTRSQTATAATASFASSARASSMSASAIAAQA